MEHNIAYGEAVSYLWLFWVLLTILFVIVLLIRSLFRNKDKFYLWLVAVIVVQAAVTLFVLINVT